MTTHANADTAPADTAPADTAPADTAPADTAPADTAPADTESADTRLKEIIAEQEEIFVRRQPASARLAVRAAQHLTGGVTSSWQITAPQPVWLSRGRGSKVWDVDGNEYVDLHGGYGAALAGHAHPAIAKAITNQAQNGTHFAQPTRDAVTVAAELSARFGLPSWRFANSGTEATMDAVHLMRSATGRDLIIKIEGCYHGHHDSVQVSVAPDERRDHQARARLPREPEKPAPLRGVVLYAGLDRIDPAPIEAGRDLGLGRVRTFIHITLPLSRQAILTGMLITVLPMLGDYFTNQLLSGTAGTTMFGNVIDDQLNASGGVLQGEGAVFSLLFLLVLIAPMIYYVVATNRSSRGAT